MKNCALMRATASPKCKSGGFVNVVVEARLFSLLRFQPSVKFAELLRLSAAFGNLNTQLAAHNLNFLFFKTSQNTFLDTPNLFNASLIYEAIIIPQSNTYNSIVFKLPQP